MTKNMASGILQGTSHCSTTAATHILLPSKLSHSVYVQKDFYSVERSTLQTAGSSFDANSGATTFSTTIKNATASIPTFCIERRVYIVMLSVIMLGTTTATVRSLALTLLYTLSQLASLP
jgi:hypothetical protein